MASESTLRRRLKQMGYIARKSRWRRDSVDNHGGFQIINPFYNAIVAGVRFDLTLEDLEEFCKAD